MGVKDHLTAAYRIITVPEGSSYRFFCDASGMALCTTKPIRRNTQAEELKAAWETEGRQHFNRCSKCGKWVGDPMFNADVLMCVDCAPWQERPNYCIGCGKKISSLGRYCNACGMLLHNGEVVG